jgi:hypothetical protein
MAAGVDQTMDPTSRRFHVAMLFSESMDISLRASMRVRSGEAIQTHHLLKNDVNLENSMKALQIKNEFPIGYLSGSEPLYDLVKGGRN